MGELEMSEKKFKKLTKDVFDNIEDEKKVEEIITSAIDAQIIEDLKKIAEKEEK